MKFNAIIRNVTEDYVKIRVYGIENGHITLSRFVAEGLNFELEEGKEIRLAIQEP